MTLQLNHNLSFHDLYDAHGLRGLRRIDSLFLRSLPTALAQELQNARSHKPSPQQLSSLILNLTPHLNSFLANLFNVQSHAQKLIQNSNDARVVQQCKTLFIRRVAAKHPPLPSPPTDKFTRFLSFKPSPKHETRISSTILQWLKKPDQHQQQLLVAQQYFSWAIHSPLWKNSALTFLPKPIPNSPETPVNSNRDGFSLTDPGLPPNLSLSHAHYCLICHHRNKDSCSHGIPSSPHPVKQVGCPLNQKISEMHHAAQLGYLIAALAVVTLDNPLPMLTGRRICNACSLACIFQKQSPVDTPNVETHILETVLNLPYGTEILSLLTRWNPLNTSLPLPLPPSKKHVLVAGIGPAGALLSLLLLNHGHSVLALDAAHIPPNPIPFQPVKSFSQLSHNLDSRTAQGFGGVAEYGVTARWNKNFLSLARIVLERRIQFSLSPSTQLGAEISPQLAVARGFHHVALATGSSQPALPPWKNPLPNGARAATDFLMTLHLGNAQKLNAQNAPLVQLPVVVVGAGLTAVDAATEALAYYPRQAERLLSLHKQNAPLPDSTEINTILKHAKLIQQERSLAKKQRRKPNLLKLLNSWGGCSIVYRKSIQESPAFKTNPHELQNALNEGVQFVQNAQVLSVLSHNQQLHGILVKTPDNPSLSIPAKTLLYAVGAQQNIALSKNLQLPNPLPKPKQRLLTALKLPNRASLSLWGDANPHSTGSVVHAMGGVKDAFPELHNTLSQLPSRPRNPAPNLLRQLQSTVLSVTPASQNAVLLKIRSPLRAKQFQPGQFFRLQNSPPYPQTPFEPLAMTGAHVQGDAISLISLKTGGSSNLILSLKPGDPVSVMGPAGTPSDIQQSQCVVLVGGGVGTAALLPVGRRIRQNGGKTILFAAFRHPHDVLPRRLLHQAADVLVLACDQRPIPVRRAHDVSHHGNVIQALISYAQSSPLIPLNLADSLFLAGSASMMHAVAVALSQNPLKPSFNPNIRARASVNAPMQCMSKGLCARCLQQTTDGRLVFACDTQELPIADIDFQFLKTRLGMDAPQEQVSKATLEQQFLDA